MKHVAASNQNDGNKSIFFNDVFSDDALECLSLMEELEELLSACDELELEINKIRSGIIEKMKDNGVKNIITDDVEIWIDAGGALQIIER